MQDTPNLALPLIAAAQAQKHVTHNEALLAVDALVQCAVADKDLASPPASPAAGDRYIVASGASGAWSGRSGTIAAWEDAFGWRYHGPKPGFMAFVQDEALLYVFDGVAWIPLGSVLGAIQNLSRLGIGTSADATNPFSAKLNKALWTAKTVVEGGDGDLRYTLNKETAADILSLLFQTGFSGRLEIGLVGSDNLSVKVSADGATWRTAMTVDSATGGLDFLTSQATVASAATCAIGDVPHRSIVITGGTTILSFGTAPRKERLITFAGALALTHNPTSLILPGGANITTGAGDSALASSDGTGKWTVRHYQRATTAAAAADLNLATGSAARFASLGLNKAAICQLDLEPALYNSKMRMSADTHGVAAVGAVPALELLGTRSDGNSFYGRVGLGYRRTDGTPVASGALVGAYAFGGQWGTDTSIQPAKVLYAASVMGITEGAYTSATAMPTALDFCTGMVGATLDVFGAPIGTGRWRVQSSGHFVPLADNA